MSKYGEQLANFTDKVFLKSQAILIAERMSHL